MGLPEFTTGPGQRSRSGLKQPFVLSSSKGLPEAMTGVRQANLVRALHERGAAGRAARCDVAQQVRAAPDTGRAHPAGHRRDWRRIAVMVSPINTPRVVPTDPDDDPVIAAAVTGHFEFIASGCPPPGHSSPVMLCNRPHKDLPTQAVPGSLARARNLRSCEPGL